MHVRRLVKAGQASHTVSLPKNWIEKNGLTKGSVIYIKEKSDTELLVSPEVTEDAPVNKEITITTEGKEVGTVQREITSAYINNYNTITIIGKDLNTKAKDIRKVLHDFVALEIAEQTSSKIVAKDLLNLKEISVDQTIRRMDMIIRSIFQDLITTMGGKEVHESVQFRDFDVNRLYFLITRLMKGSLKDIRIAESFGLNHLEIMSRWSLALNLENIADAATNISVILTKLKKKSEAKDVQGLYKELEAHYLDVMKSYFNKDKKLGDNVAGRRMEFFHKCHKFGDKNKDPYVARLMESFKELNNYICNIARIVIDEE